MKATPARSAPGFYVVGGTMRHDAPSYVERRADKELRSSLLRNEFCHVLTARQMGKSSLMLRTAASLRESGIGVVVLDLTAIGQNLTAEQWYCGLLLQMGSRLNMEGELLEFWGTERMVGPMQRWVRAIRQVVLPRHPGRLVIFIDEIDVVRSLTSKFSTDEFFAGIRECYNLRNEDSEAQRLTFCLLGVATPSDLILDVRTTPFNVGTRIELNDFTEEEALPLADGLHLGRERNRAILKRVLYWTGGHPYLTQRICQAVAENEHIQDDRDLDHLIEELFFSKRAQEYDDNLIFVREHLLRSGADRTALLTLYSKIRRGRRVPEDDPNPLVSILRLSGIARLENGLLRVRNRIYARVFNSAWVTSSLPDFEVRRQREAYRRGVIRAAAVSTVILAVVAALAVIAIRERNRAVEQASDNKRLLYTAQAAQMKLTQQEMENGNMARVEELLEATRPLPGQEDLRGFEWYLFYGALHNAAGRMQMKYPIANLKFLPGRNTLAIGEAQASMQQGQREYLIKFYDLEEGRDLSSFSVAAGKHFDIVEFSPDLQCVATDTQDNTVAVWDTHSGQKVTAFRGHTAGITAVAFSPDKRYLASSDLSGVWKIWDTLTGGEKLTRSDPGRLITDLAFSPDSRLLAAADDTRVVRLLDIGTGKELPPFSIKEGSLGKVFFSEDGKRLGATTKNGLLYFWDMVTGRAISPPLSHTTRVLSFSFSPDGKTLATGSVDRKVKLWDVATGRELRTIRGHGAAVKALAWSSDGRLLTTGDDNGTIKIWDAFAKELPVLPSEAISSIRATAFTTGGELMGLGISDTGHVKLWNLSTGRELSDIGKGAEKVLCAAFSRDGKTVATGGMDNTVRIHDVSTGQLIGNLIGHNSYIYGLDFSPDGKTIISGDAQGNLKLWEFSTGRELATLNSGNSYYRAVFSPDGKSLATADQDGAVRLWDLTSLKITKTLTGHTSPVRFIAFSPDERLMATGANDNTVRLWDIAEGKELKRLVQSDSIPRFAFTTDGKRLVTGGLDGSVKLWDVMNMQEVITLINQGGEVTSVTFSLNGNVLAVSSDDGAVKVWHAADNAEPDPR